MTIELKIVIVSGALTLLGTIITVCAGIYKTKQEANVRQAVTDTKIDELTREVRLHNDFAIRIPVIQSEIEDMKEDIRALKERIK